MLALNINQSTLAYDKIFILDFSFDISVFLFNFEYVRYITQWLWLVMHYDVIIKLNAIKVISNYYLFISPPGQNQESF